MITLKENANIYYLRDREGYDYLVQNFYAREDQFSFQQLSHCYDGIYVDILSLASKLDSELVKLFASFGVNSLILFQKGAIQYYQSGVVLIDRFDYECGSVYRFIPYHIEIEEEKKLVGSCKKLQKA